MKVCRTCLYPDTKPDLHFDETGQCSACRNYFNRPQIDWDERKEQLLKLLDRHDGRCIVPSSGGKDSTYQVIKLLELGADPLVVTASTCHLTDIGRSNINNLARYATTIEISPNKQTRAILNRLGLELVGDISWPEHASIFSTPFRVATETSIPLIFYGENPQNQYGGPIGSEESKTMTRRWITEFGGFLGLRPSDFIGMDGLKERHMRDYMLPSVEAMDRVGVEAHFLGQYIPWDSHENAKVAIAHGMQWFHPSYGSWWHFENLDNAQTGIHDWFGYLKYGYTRACAQISVDIRSGEISREEGELWLNRLNKIAFPERYMTVHYEEILDGIGMSVEKFFNIADKYTNTKIHKTLPSEMYIYE